MIRLTTHLLLPQQIPQLRPGSHRRLACRIDDPRPFVLLFSGRCKNEKGRV